MVMNTLIPWRITFLKACFRGWLQSIPFLVLVRTHSRRAKPHAVTAGNKVSRDHLRNSQAAGHEVRWGRVLTEHARMQYLLPDNLSGFHCRGQQILDWIKKKKKMLLLCLPFKAISWFYSKQSNNSSFMLRMAGEKLFHSSFLRL